MTGSNVDDRRSPTANPRKAINLTVKLAHRGVDEFVEKYATNISNGGMFIRTREPKPLGTVIQFKVEIAGGQRVLQGSATVRWVRGANEPAGPQGMGLEFEKLDESSAALIKRMLAGRPDDGSELGAFAVGSTEELAEPSAPPTAPVAAAPAVAKAVPSKPAPATVTKPAAAAPSAAKKPAAPAPAVPPAQKPAAAPPAAAKANLSKQAPTVAPAAAKPAPKPSAPPKAAPAAPAKPPAKAAPAAAPARKPPAAPAELDEPFGGLDEALTGAAVLEDEPLPTDLALDSLFSDPEMEVATAPAAPDRVVDIDLDSLVAQTPAPPPPFEAPLSTAPVEVDIELASEFIEPLPPAPAPPPPPAPKPKAPAPAPVAKAPPPAVAAPPPPPPPAPPAQPLPPVRRPTDPPIVAAVTAPVVLTEGGAPPPPAPARASAKTVFLKPPTSIDPTGPVVGIDLGTSNTVCSVLVNGKPQILRSKDGYNLIPSIVAISRQGAMLVGNRARSQVMLNPQQSVYGAKRLVGRDYDSETVKQVRERFHYQVTRGPDGKAAVMLGQQMVALEEVQGIILAECKQMAEQHLGRGVTRAVITCPAYYSEQQREAVRIAAKLAGLKVERVLNEPTAAALAYGLNRSLAKKVLVYDLGGGTFDATIMRIDDNAFEVLATGGDVFLGGLDFDNQIVDVLLQRFEKQHGIAFSGDPVALSRISAEAERTKVALSERKSVDVHLPMLEMTPQGQGLDLKCTITRDELNTMCKHLVDRTIDVVKDALLDAKLKMNEIDDIILVGGMSRMPMVREKLTELLGKAPLASVNADEAVALGAALYAGTVDKISDVVLIDVVPMTIGVGMPGGGFKRIIERNTPLPASRSFSLATSKDNEDHIELSLFQGEDATVVGNEYIGTTRIEGLPKGPKGAVQIAVTVKLDAECVVHVEARELRTRATFTATMATRYTNEEIRSKLGIASQTQPSAAQGQRAAELQQRGGRFWGFLKRVVGRA